MNKNKEAFIDKMKNDGLKKPVIDIFCHYFDKMIEGDNGLLYEGQDFERSPDPRPLSSLDSYAESGRKFLEKCVMCKLNGGLGTTMGLEGPKGLLPVRGEKTFLDIVLRQTEFMRKSGGSDIPALFMNSFATSDDTMRHISEKTDFVQDMTLEFIQNKFPKINEGDLMPVSYPVDPEKEWNPPGHGDFYIALNSSGVLDSLLEKGFEFLFLSNIDNLGAVMEYRILGYMADENISFISEVTRRTPMDKKGGHLGTKTDGNLMLRDTAQCPEEELDKFMDIEYFRYFNINNIWMNLKCLKKELEKQGGFFRLPLIKNKKTVNPVDPESAKVIQVESTVGSGIQFFNGASAIEVPRSRFLPVKSTSDLLLVCSDLYDYNEKTGMLSAREEASAGRAYIELDKKFFGRMKDFSERFPSGFPSLKKCRSFKVSGPFVFGRGTIVEGEVSLVNNSNKNIHIPEGTRLHPGSSAADFGS